MRPEEFKKKFAEQKGQTSFKSLWLDTIEYKEDDLINELMESYASQQVQEYKEKLKKEIEHMRDESSNLYASITLDRVIDKL